jgi:hypothetical protein
MKPRYTEKECTAYHEAGHAVAAFELRRGVRQVTIEPDPERGTLGHVLQRSLLALCRDQSDPGAPRQRARVERAHVEREILCCFAGGIAEGHFRGRRNHVGARTDRKCALELASRLCGDLNETRAYLRWLLLRTRNLVLSQWPGVKRVAAELLVHRTLTGPKARKAYLAGINDDMNAHA